MTTNLRDMLVRDTGRGLVQCGAIALVIALLTATTASALSLTPLYSSTLGPVNNLSIAELQTNWVVTAAQNATDNLELTVWNNTGTALVPTSDLNSSTVVTAVHTTDLDPNRVVTVVINKATLEMQLDVWLVTLPAGTIVQQNAPITISGKATSVSITTLDSAHVATAAIIGGALHVNVFNISPTGVITKGGGATGGPATENASIVTVSPSLVVSAVGNASKGLEVTAWGIGAGTVTKFGSATPGLLASKIEAAYWAPYVVTEFINSNKSLELMAWSVSGGAVVAQAGGTGGPASPPSTWISVVNGPLAPAPITGVIGSGKNLALAAWDSPAPTTLATTATVNLPPTITQVALAPDNNAQYFVTATRVSATGALQVTQWWFH